MLNCFESYNKIIFVDATMDGQPEGTISLIRPKFASDFPSALSVHDVGLKDMIEAVYLMETQPDLYLFTISIEKVEPMTTELAPKVKKAIPRAIDQIMDLVDTLHHQIS